MAKGARRKSRSRRATYKRSRRHANTPRDVPASPVRTLTVDDLPENSKLRPPHPDEDTNPD